MICMDLSHWVIEENGFQRAIRQDTDLKDYCCRTGIYLRRTSDTEKQI